MKDLFLHWWHHSNNFPNGISLGLPLFAWNRLAKFLLLIFASIILLEILGVERVEQWFAARHGEFAARIDRYEAWHSKIMGWLINDLRLEVGLIRYLFSKRTSSDRFTQGRVSRPLAIALMIILAFSIILSVVPSLGFLLTWHDTLLHRVIAASAYCVITFPFLILIGLALLLGITALLWLINAAVLRSGERLALFGVRVTLRWMRDKGAPHAARTLSFVLLLLGFVMDLLTS